MWTGSSECASKDSFKWGWLKSRLVKTKSTVLYKIACAVLFAFSQQLEQIKPTLTERWNSQLLCLFLQASQRLMRHRHVQMGKFHLAAVKTDRAAHIAVKTDQTVHTAVPTIRQVLHAVKTARPVPRAARMVPQANTVAWITRRVHSVAITGLSTVTVIHQASAVQITEQLAPAETLKSMFLTWDLITTSSASKISLREAIAHPVKIFWTIKLPAQWIASLIKFAIL